MHNIRVMFWCGRVKEEVLFVAIDSRERAFFEFRTRGCAPEIYSVITGSVKILKCMFNSVVVMFVGTAICL